LFIVKQNFAPSVEGRCWGPLGLLAVGAGLGVRFIPTRDAA